MRGGMRRGGFGRRMFRPRIWRPMFWWPRLFLMGSFLIFLFGAMPYKLYREDVRVIERETGRQAKDLTEDELIAAMKKLGIKKLELTSEDREAIERS